MDLGAPISYLVLERGTDVLSADHHPIGQVEHVLADEREDVFDGIVITRGGIGRGHVFADADQISEIYERGVVLDARRTCLRAVARAVGQPGGRRRGSRRPHHRQAPARLGSAVGQLLNAATELRVATELGAPTERDY